MKASELRIGNFYSQFGNVHETSYFTIETLTKAPKQQLWCKPIPITEEWLLNFGFVPNGFSMVKGEFDAEIWLESEIGHTFKWNDFVISISLKYVHQLQNLYFALTGKELIIK